MTFEAQIVRPNFGMGFFLIFHCQNIAEDVCGITYVAVKGEISYGIRSPAFGVEQGSQSVDWTIFQGPSFDCDRLLEIADCNQPISRKPRLQSPIDVDFRLQAPIMGIGMNG